MAQGSVRRIETVRGENCLFSLLLFGFHQSQLFRIVILFLTPFTRAHSQTCACLHRSLFLSLLSPCRNNRPWEEGHVKIRIRRSHALQDSVDALESIDAQDMHLSFRYVMSSYMPRHLSLSLSPLIDMLYGVSCQDFHSVSSSPISITVVASLGFLSSP